MNVVQWFETLPTVATGIIIVGGFVAVTLAVGWLVGRMIPRQMRVEHNDLAGFIFAVVGVVYAVLLGFIAIGVWERFEDAEVRSWTETANIAAVYRDVGAFAQGPQIRAQLREYVELVSGEEFAAMRSGRESARADAMVELIHREIRDLPVKSRSQADVHIELLGNMNAALADRDERLNLDATGLNGLMWAILFSGAVVTVGFTYLFGFKERVMQNLMIGALGMMIGLVLFLAVALDYPFRGSITVGPEAFETLSSTFRVIGL
jgi:hypothetical protein